MELVEKAFNKLMLLEWSELQGLMLACSEGHALMCVASGEDVDPHAARETIRNRIADMGKEELARALAPFAALGDLIHEHHPGHERV
jgi:hypothetical protein